MRKRREPLNLFRSGNRGDSANSQLRPRLRQNLDQTFNQRNLRLAAEKTLVASPAGESLYIYASEIFNFCKFLRLFDL